MDSGYFKRFRMEVDLTVARPGPLLPSGYRFVPWNEAVLDVHARTKHRAFRDEIDAVVFPCLGSLDGCRRLMREIRAKPGFLPATAWLIARGSAAADRGLAAADRGSAPAVLEWCGTIQGIVDRGGVGMIQNIGIVPGHRGLGLGTCLILQALAGFRSHGLRTASLEVTAYNCRAVQLYQRLGFRRTRTVYKVVDEKTVPSDLVAPVAVASL